MIIKKKILAASSSADPPDNRDFTPFISNKNTHNVKIANGANNLMNTINLNIKDKTRGVVTQPSIINGEIFLDDSDL